jgi:hypothetical protein
MFVHALSHKVLPRLQHHIDSIWKINQYRVKYRNAIFWQRLFGMNAINTILLKDNAPIKVKPQGGRSGICGAFDFPCNFVVKFPTMHGKANISQMWSNAPLLGTHICGERLESRLSQSSTRALPQDARWRSNIPTLRRWCRSNSRGWGNKNRSNAPHMPDLSPWGLILIGA